MTTEDPSSSASSPPSENESAGVTTNLRERLRNPINQGVMHAEALAEIEHLDRALKIAGHNIVELTEQRSKLTAALNTALFLVDQLVNELRINNCKPPGHVVVAKARMDQEMRKLLGRE